MIELFKKEGFYSHFEAAMNNTGTIVASSMASPPDPLRNPERLAAVADTDLPGSEAEEAFDRLTRMVTRLRCQTSCAT